MSGGSAGNRTRDHQLKRLLLYQLSYRPKMWLYFIGKMGLRQDIMLEEPVLAQRNLSIQGQLQVKRTKYYNYQSSV